MDNHFQLTDEEFAKQFANKTLKPQLFSHEAHLRLAWIHINQYGEELAIQNICSQIKAFDQTFGDGTKYHKTLTIAAIKAVSHFIGKSNSNTFQEFIEEFPRLKSNFKDLMGAHYGFDIFNNEEAKANYLEPDLLPFT